MYMAALKQCLAIFFLLLALPYALDKKYIRFYLLVFVAIFFHTHAFMFAIVPLLLEKPWGKVTWALLGATIFAMLTYDYTLGAFMEYAQSIGALVDEGELFDGHSINVLRVLVYWIPALLVSLPKRFPIGSADGTVQSAFLGTAGAVCDGTGQPDDRA